MTLPAPSLGRVFLGHDQRSRAYGVREAVGTPERKTTWWPMPAGAFPLDQGAEGACTGYGMVQELAAGPVVLPGMNRSSAEQRYRRNREIDKAEGRDVGAEGATVLGTMKAAQADGLISGYRWCFGVDDVVNTLCSVGPVCLGIEWYQDMYATRPGGLVMASGPVVGGHFITALGYVKHPRFGECVAWLNSWGSGYGVGEPALNVKAGVGYVQVSALARLLAADGEAVVPSDFLAPAKPTPVPPAPKRRKWWWFGR